MNKEWTVAVVLAGLVVTCGFVIGGARAQSSVPAQATTAAPGQQPIEKKAEEQFKNIRVLKGISADQLIPSMQFISASLGVECEFCHVRGAFEKDDKKPKQTARQMMEMMFAINADNFDRERKVTCYSCHRGSTEPVGMPPVMTEEPKEAMAEPEKAEQEKPSVTADQLLDKYVQAAGGAAAIEKITSRVMKGTIDFGGMSLPIDIYAKDPEKRISFTHTRDGDSVTAFNGHEGWLGMPGGQVREMRGSDLDGAAIDADLHLATHLKQMFSEIGVVGEEKVGDHESYLAEGQRKGKPPILLNFDEKTGLLVRLVRFGETALGRLPTQIDYADYRDTDGVKIPYRWTLARPNGRFTIQLSEVKQNIPVDEGKFVKPAPAAEPPK
jgi:photosynthetic reaction center cytochrome c subunit